MSGNKDFYKRVGFIFIGIIVVLVIARFTVLDSGKEKYFNKTTDVSVKQSKKTISWQDADKYYGKLVNVEGRIIRTYNSGKACFLNFHSDYRRYFTAVIFKSDFDKFPPSPEEYYKGKKVQVTGAIKEYKGSPEIILNSPSQIKILEGK